jgi:hypothetical protein
MNLKYQTIQPSKGYAPNTQGEIGGGIVKLAQKLVVGLNDFSVGFRIKRELKWMDEKIKKAFGNHYGVLVVAQTKEWAIPDPTGNRAKQFLSMHIGGAGDNFRIVLKRYLLKKRFVQGTGEGWRPSENHYIWVTKEQVNSGEFSQ